MREDLKTQNWINKRNFKRLIKRTLKKKRKKRIRAFNHEQNHMKNQETKSLMKIKHRIVYRAPAHLSLINNSLETIKYFNSIIDDIFNQNIKNVTIDIKNVDNLTIDAVMYLIAIITNLKKNEDLHIYGNVPINNQAKDLIYKSGFFKFVNSRIRTIPDDEENHVCIITGEKVDNDSAARICDFIIKKLDANYIYTKYLYAILIELMGNTRNHAYKEVSPFVNRWYLYADYDKSIKKIKITFLDTGMGIPKTVAKKLIEKAANIFKTNSHNAYMYSAFNGESRTRTLLGTRGNGLPEVYGYYKRNKISNLKVISCKGYLDFNSVADDTLPDDMNDLLQGTVYYWEMDLRSE